jgi:hypothetical protein
LVGSRDFEHQQFRIDAGLIVAAGSCDGAQCLTLADVGDAAVRGSEECSSTGALVPLPRDDGSACLDGSPYGVYFLPSRRGSTKWTLYFEGGGWCATPEECAERSETPLGSSLSFPPTRKCACMNTMAALAPPRA